MSVDPTADATWDNEVGSHGEANVFHSAAWARVLIETYAHRPFYLRVGGGRDGSAMLPVMEVASRLTGRRGVSLPFSDFCTPLLSGGVPQLEMVDAVIKVGHERRWKYYELRGASLGNSPVPAASFYGHELDLRCGPASLMSNFASSVRRNLQKAERSGVTVTIARTSEAVSDYYKLHERTRRRHGAPPQSRRFFSSLYEHLLKRDLGFVVLAQREKRTLAGAIFLNFGENAIYKFGASDERLQEHRANNLVMWEGIRFLSEGGWTTLHFGRTSPRNAGLRRFKRAWGSTEEAITYSKYNFVTGSWATGDDADIARAASKVFTKLPLKVNRFIGKMVYPHLD